MSGEWWAFLAGLGFLPLAGFVALLIACVVCMWRDERKDRP